MRSPTYSVTIDSGVESRPEDLQGLARYFDLALQRSIRMAADALDGSHHLSLDAGSFLM